MNAAQQGPSPIGGTSSRFFSIDLIRVVALLCIIGTHFNVFLTGVSPTSKPLFWCDLSYSLLNSLNGAGVSAFFIVSGAGLMLSKRDTFAVGTFIRRRFLALYPLYWLTYLFVGLFVVKGYSFELRTPLILSVFAVDGLLSRTLPTYYLIGEWYMGCLIVLYCLFPFVRKLFLIDRLFPLLAAALCVTGTVVLYHFSMPIEWFPLSRVLEFVFGFYFITLLNREHNNLMAFFEAAMLVVLYVLIWYTPVTGVLKDRGRRNCGRNSLVVHRSIC